MILNIKHRIIFDFFCFHFGFRFHFHLFMFNFWLHISSSLHSGWFCILSTTLSFLSTLRMILNSLYINWFPLFCIPENSTFSPQQLISFFYTREWWILPSTANFISLQPREFCILPATIYFHFLHSGEPCILPAIIQRKMVVSIKRLVGGIVKGWGYTGLQTLW